MLNTTLQKLIDDGLTNAKEVGELTGVAPSTVYRWLRGDSEPTFNSVRLLVRHLPHRGAQAAILNAFISATNWRFEHLEVELDVNMDGQVNATDALDATIDMMRCAAEALAGVREAGRNKSINEEEAAKLVSVLSNVIQRCTQTQRVLTHLAEARATRKIRLAE